MFPVVITFRSEEGRTLCTLQHHLHAPGLTDLGGEGGIQGRQGRSCRQGHGPRVTARSHTHMSRLFHRDPMIVKGGVVVAPVSCDTHLCQVFREHPCRVCPSRPLAMAFHPVEHSVDSTATWKGQELGYVVHEAHHELWLVV